MLIAKGFDVGFLMAGGEEFDIGAPMLHDPDGAYWPKCSLLFIPFKRGREQAPVEGDVRHYFGRDYDALMGRVPELPPKDLDAWKLVGEVDTIYYERPGLRAPGPFKHKFGRRRLAALFRKGKASLYRHGRGVYRLELGKSCIADDRGIVFP